MIIIMKPDASQEAITNVTHMIEEKGLAAHLSKEPRLPLSALWAIKASCQAATSSCLKA